MQRCRTDNLCVLNAGEKLNEMTQVLVKGWRTCMVLQPFVYIENVISKALDSNLREKIKLNIVDKFSGGG